MTRRYDKALLGEYIDNMVPATSAFGDILRQNLQDESNER
jgi:hypothetical protein